jgi:hypothetical protein
MAIILNDMNYYEKCRSENGDVTSRQYIEWLGKQLKPSIVLKYDKPVLHWHDCVRLAVNGCDWNLITTIEGMKSFSDKDVEEINYIYGNQ